MSEYSEIIRVAFELLILIAAITPTEKDNNILDRLKNIGKILRVIK